VAENKSSETGSPGHIQEMENSEVAEVRDNGEAKSECLSKQVEACSERASACGDVS
jgi:hypothetical protein